MGSRSAGGRGALYRARTADEGAPVPISPMDEYCAHQTHETFDYVYTSDRHFYDRYYFNCHSSSDEIFLVTGLGQYPNLGVSDAFVSISHGTHHYVVRASRELGSDRLDTSVGPLSVEVLEDQSERSDVTAQHADLSARLENLETAEAELRELMSSVRESGGNTEDVLAIHRQVTETRGQIDSLQGQLDVLSEQVALSTITVSLEPEPVPPIEAVAAWRPGLTFQRAQADLVSALQSLTNAAIYVSVALLPLLILVGLGAYVVYRVIMYLRRRSSRG